MEIEIVDISLGDQVKSRATFARERVADSIDTLSSLKANSIGPYKLGNNLLQSLKSTAISIPRCRQQQQRKGNKERGREREKSMKYKWSSALLASVRWRGVCAIF